MKMQIFLNDMFNFSPKTDVDIEHLKSISTHWNDVYLMSEILSEIKKRGEIPKKKKQLAFSTDFKVIKHSIDFAISWTATELSPNASHEFSQWCEFCNLSSEEVSELSSIVKQRLQSKKKYQPTPELIAASDALIEARKNSVPNFFPSLVVGSIFGLLMAIIFTVILGNELPEKFIRLGQIGTICAGVGTSVYAKIQAEKELAS